MSSNDTNNALAQIHTTETIHQKLLRGTYFKATTLSKSLSLRKIFRERRLHTASETPGPLDYNVKQRTMAEKTRGGHISKSSGLKFPSSVAALHKEKPSPASYRPRVQKYRSAGGKFTSKEPRFRSLEYYKQKNVKVTRSARGGYYIHTTPRRGSRSLSPERRSSTTYVDTPIPKTARQRIAEYKNMRRTPIQNRLFPGARKIKMVNTIGSAYKRSRSVPRRRRKITPSPIHHHYENSTPASKGHEKHAHDRPDAHDMSDDELENRLGAEMGFHKTTRSDGVFMESLRSHPGKLTPDERGWKDQRKHSKFHNFHSKHGDGNMLMEAVHKLEAAAYVVFSSTFERE